MLKKNCNFYSLENPCYQKICVKQTVQKVESEEIDLLVLRARLPRRDINSICGNHEQVFLKKFLVLKRKCCDPFTTDASKARRKSLKVLTADTYYKFVEPPQCVGPSERVFCACLITPKHNVGISFESTETDPNIRQVNGDQSVINGSTEGSSMSVQDCSLPERYFFH